ncbi:multidrug effflux MFS transporter [Microbaculum marinum]|uniref:Bcr/CflA family efflux transporter n=1 Tax=Microbaculum marinum TaxID=1764581 RepID=A0AAW9RGX9_9HYPH
MSRLTREEAAAGIRRGELLLVLIVATGIGILSMNMVLPSLPGMADEFGVGYNAVQYVLTVFLFALSFAQLVYGSLSDRFGRRPVMIAGFVVFIAGSLLCAVAWSLPVLLVGRFIQGAGGCAGMVLGRAILRDLYDRDRAASLLGYVTMSMVLAPMLGPAIGGGFEETLGWRAGIFSVAAVAAGVLVLVWLRLPETHYNRGVSTGFLNQFRSFTVLARSPVFLCYAGTMSCTTGTFFAFLGAAPFIVIEVMGRGPGEFGLWAMMIAFGYMIGNFVTGRYAERVGTRRMIFYGILVSLVGTAILLALARFGPAIPIVLFAPMMLVTFSNGLVMASAVTSSVSVRPDLAGAASGLGGFLQIGTGAIATIVVGLAHDGTAVPMALIILAFALGAAGCFALAVRYPDPVETPIH